MSASMVIILVVSPINIVLQYVLGQSEILSFIDENIVWSPINIGVIGAPIAISISYIVLAILMILYVAYVKGAECWGGIEYKEMLSARKLWTFLSLGAPGIAMMASEWWAFEIIALGSGLLGERFLAAQTIVLNTCGLTYMGPLGFAIAATTRIGNALGADCPNRARCTAFGSLGVGQLLACVNSIVLLIVKDKWGFLWTEDAEVVRVVAQVLPLAAIFQLSDATGAISGGVLRGIGRQDIGAYLNIFGYYVVGLPFGFYACFYLNLGLFGLWLGLTIGLIFVSIVQVIIIFRTDWREEAKRAHDLIAAKTVEDEVDEESCPETPTLRGEEEL
ncbi:hypothetical protein HDU97_001994 [Phlyctochytrium planicorne]|nr:hypothetical protein HDU97_001994 [Phlyctochytrium planicorne]